MKFFLQIISIKICFLFLITVVTCSSKHIPNVLKDTIAPDIPTNLSTSDFSKTSFTLGWTASTENVGISCYEVFKNGLSIGITDKTSMSVTGLTEGKTYEMTVRACDSSANWSAQSAVLNVIIRSDIDRTITHGSQLLLSDVGTLGILTPSGSISTSYDGQVIENLIITGNININHNNVIVRSCKIMHGNGLDGVVISAGSQNALISHCEMDALSQVRGNYGSMGVVVEGNATVIRCYMHNVRSGMSILNANGSGKFVENYIRDLVDKNGAHNTSASCHGTPGPLEVLRNNFVEGNSAGFSLYSDYGSNTNVLIQNNCIIGQKKGYGMYCGYTHLETGNAQHNSNIHIIGNRWKKPFGWGPVAAMKMDQPGAVWEDNSYEDGTPIPPKEGI